MPNRPHDTDACPDEPTLAAFVRHECPPDESSRIQRHLDACDACREAVEGFRLVVARLESIPEETPVDDLADRIVARMPRPIARRVTLYTIVRVALLAACVLLAVIVGFKMMHREDATPGTDGEVAAKEKPKPAMPAEVTRALDWLASTQEADGSWDPKRGGGVPQFKVGLTGLSLLAFLGAGETPAEGPHAETVRKAVDYLLAQQAEDGRFGPRFFKSPYNTGIATVALLETWTRTKRDDLKDPIDRGLARIIARQDADGGWSYVDPMASTNTSITAWQLHALILADAHGWTRAHEPAEKGLAWLDGVIDEKGRAGYEKPGSFPDGPVGLTAMAAFCLSSAGDHYDGPHAGDKPVIDALLSLASQDNPKIDYVHLYFITHALETARRRDGIDDQKLARLASRLRRPLIDGQLKEGPDSGSWEPTDQWSKAGGRAYATAMATLSLQADARTELLASARH